MKTLFLTAIISGRGGKICLTDHFKPLWARNVPKFGIAHAMALGVSRVKGKLRGNLLGNLPMLSYSKIQDRISFLISYSVLQA